MDGSRPGLFEQSHRRAMVVQGRAKTKPCRQSLLPANRRQLVLLAFQQLVNVP